jgi:transposase-like protein
VEMDETYIGGKQRGHRRKKYNKECVVGIRERGGDLRLIHTVDATAELLAKHMQDHIDPNVKMLITDEWPAYPPALKSAGIHELQHHTIRHKDHVYVQGPIYTNTVESAFSLFKRGIAGSWHRVSPKHLAAYLNEMTFRFNRRKNPDLFVDTLRHPRRALCVGLTISPKLESKWATRERGRNRRKPAHHLRERRVICQREP